MSGVWNILSVLNSFLRGQQQRLGKLRLTSLPPHDVRFLRLFVAGFLRLRFLRLFVAGDVRFLWACCSVTTTCSIA